MMNKDWYTPSKEWSERQTKRKEGEMEGYIGGNGVKWGEQWALACSLAEAHPNM